MKKALFITAFCLAYNMQTKAQVYLQPGYTTGSGSFWTDPQIRMGTGQTGPNTGTIKWTTANEFGLFTWGEAKPIRIGGSLVKFQQEGGGSNNVYMSGKLGLGTATPTFKLELINGNVRFNSPTSGNVDFNNPNGEDGHSISYNGKRADLRYDGVFLKMVTSNTGSTPLSTNGIAIDNFGHVAIGNNNPNALLHVTQNNANEWYGAQFDGNSSTSVTHSIVNITETGIPSAPLSPYGPYALVAMRKTAEDACGAYFQGKKYGIISTAEQATNSTAIKADAGVFTPMSSGSTYTGLAAQVLRAGTVYGVKADVGDAIQVSTLAYGGRFEAMGTTAYGVYGKAAPAGSFTALYGIYGEAPVATNSWAGYFNGDVYTTSPMYYTSDMKFKKDIIPMQDALDNVMKLNPTTYEFKRDEYSQMNLPEGKRYGFIAQELEKIFPIMVRQAHHPETKDKDGNVVKEAVDFKSVSYIELIPVLTKAIQEQQTQIENQQAQIEEMKKMLASSGANNTTGSGTNTTDGSTKGYLSQNVPNPFTQSTVISYQLPANTKTAGIGVYDLNGREIKLFSLGAETTGSVTIDGGSMQPGMYVYTLLINGMPYETKKMVLTSR
ncbi:MAG: tail fiber domain-containing protein [Flavipsychrobacter sp.]|jgi:hypothetical protein